MQPEEIAANFTWTVTDGFYSLFAIIFLVAVALGIGALIYVLTRTLPTMIMAAVRNRRKTPTNVSLASNKEPLV